MGGKAGVGAWNPKTKTTLVPANTEYQQARGGGPNGGVMQDYRAAQNKIATENRVRGPRPGPAEPAAGPPGPPPFYAGGPGGALTDPGMSEKYAQETLDRYGGGKYPGVSNNAQGAYDTFSANMPNIPEDAGLDAYYKNASRLATEDIRKQMAARGAYASSASGDQISEALMNLAGQRARDEADYRLKGLGEKRAWETTRGNLAQGADTSSALGSNTARSWVSTLGDLAHTGQADKRTRYQDMFGNEIDYATGVSGVLGGGFNNMISTDKGLLDASLGMGTAAATNDVNNARYNAEVNRGNVQNAIGISKYLKDAFKKES